MLSQGNIKGECIRAIIVEPFIQPEHCMVLRGLSFNAIILTLQALPAANSVTHQMESTSKWHNKLSPTPRARPLANRLVCPFFVCWENRRTG